MQEIKCIKCMEPYVYIDGEEYICPMCEYTWLVKEIIKEKEYFDCNRVKLNNGDNVSIIKDLKIKGISSTLKQGTKVKNIRLIDEEHDITCKIDGLGVINLKTQFVKKI